MEDQIIGMIREKPEYTRKELADKLGISPDSVKYRLKKLKDTGRIEHQGSTKAGKWVVLK